jgi:DNA-binding SARP family transcriptional activator
MPLRVLGALRLDGAVGEIEITGPKRRAIMALLATRANEPVSVDLILETLWGRDDSSARSSLRTAIVALRDALKRAGINAPIQNQAWGDGRAYRLSIATADADHLEFVELGDTFPADDPAVTIELATQALALWRDTPLSDLDLIELVPFRQAMTRQRGAAVEALAQAQLAVGNAEQAARVGEAGLAETPRNESLCAVTMRALYICGRASRAVEVFRQTRESLIDAGMEPMVELVELESSILRHDDEAITHKQERRQTLLPNSLRCFLRGPFVGRSELHDEISRAGKGQAWLLSGDPGAGKSRLVAEVARSMSERGCLVLCGWASRGESLPYSLFESMLPAMETVATPPISEACGDVQRLMSGPVDSEPWALRLSIHASIESLLSLACDEFDELLLVLDDAHWADSASLSLLSRLVRSSDHRLHIVVCARSTDENSPWNEFVSQCSSIPIQSRRLPALTIAHVAEWIRVVGSDLPLPPTALAPHVHQRGGGLPFFVDAILQDMARNQPSDAVLLLAELRRPLLPSGVADPMRSRMVSLDYEVRQFLAVAAILGASFRADDVASLCRSVFGPGAWWVDESRARGLIREQAGESGSYRFDHDLTRASLTAHLDDDVQQRVHALVAELLSSRGASSAQIASHILDAVPLVEPSTAVAAVRAAAEDALSRFALDEAAALFREALDLAMTFEQRDPGLEIDLRLGSAAAAQHLGARDVAIDELRIALVAALACGDESRAARAALAAADFGEVLRNTDPVRDLLSTTLDALPKGSDLRRRVAAEWVIKTTIVEGSSEEVLTCFEQELPSSGDGAAQLDRDRTLLHVLAGSPEPTDRRRIAESIRARSEPGNDRPNRIWLDAVLFELSACLEVGDTAAARSLIDHYRAAARRAVRPGVEWLALVAASDIEQLTGNLASAAELALTALEFGTDHDIPDASDSYGAHMIVSSLLAGDLSEMSAGAEEISFRTDLESPVLPAIAGLLFAADGKHKDGIREVRRSLSAVESSPPSTLIPFTLSVAAEAISRLPNASRRDTSRAIKLLAPYSATMPRLALVGTSLGPADRLIGQLQLTIGEREHAVTSFEKAIELASRSGATGWQVLSICGLAEAAPDDTRRLGALDSLARRAQAQGHAYAASEAERVTSSR